MQDELVAEFDVTACTQHAFVDDLPEEMHRLVVGRGEAEGFQFAHMVEATFRHASPP
jgi:Holliday junction resolvasome RuvABC endonuclease subunit